MLDTMTFTKVLGGFCGALLVFLLGSWAAESIYRVGTYGEDTAAYVIDTGEEEADAADSGAEDGEADETAETETAFVDLVAQADASAGEAVWRQCAACHAIEDERNGVGPHLNELIGREIAAVDGFRYSGALPEEGEWTWENLDPWLEAPQDWASGTSMAYGGVKDDEDRANVIAYIYSFTEGAELPSAEDAADAAPAEEEATETEEAAAEDEAPASEDAASEEDASATEETETAAADTEAPAEEDAAEEGAAEEDAAEEGAAEEAEAESDAREETETADATEDEAADGGEMSEFAQAVANGDVDNGEAVFRQCQACHVADQEQNRVGPHLVDVIGREIGSVDGFRYSGALPEGEWTVDEMNAWLEAPRDYAPGTSMAYAGLRDMQDRADLVAWLESLQD
ncbi:c-type cytochrome [Rhodosalinus sp.]|uniref:c-type cytochrome n=1 Tax=Rhodosalinus sp. TaxID=2047741 RepID=UPI003569B9B6